MATQNKSGDTKKQRAYVANARDKAQARKASAGSHSSSGTVKNAKDTATSKSTAVNYSVNNAAGSKSTAGSRSSAGGKAGAGSRSSTGSRNTAGKSARSSSGANSGRNTGAASSGNRGKKSSGTYDNEQLKLKFEEDDSLRDEIAIILILLCGVLLVLSYLHLCGSFGEFLNNIIFGLMGSFGYAFPFALVFVSVFAIANKYNRSITAKTIYCVLMMIFISALVQLAAGGFGADLGFFDYYTHSSPNYFGPDKTYGGFFGGAVCKLLCPYVGNVAAAVIMVAAVIIFFLLIVGKALFTRLAQSGIDKAAEHRARRLEEEEEERLYREEEAHRLREERRSRENNRQGADNPDEELLGELFEDELISKPIKRKKPKSDFVENLMKRGMGIDTKLLDETPEYQKLKESYGTVAENVSGQKQDVSMTEFLGEAEEISNADVQEDIVSSELRKKFKDSPANSSSGLELPHLREHPSVSKTGLTRHIMVDEEPQSFTEKTETATAAHEAAGNITSFEDYRNSQNETEAFDDNISQQTENIGGNADYLKESIEDNTAHCEEPSNVQKTTADKHAETSQGLENRTGSGATTFTTPEQLAKLREEQAKLEQTPPYVFPPLNLLNKGTGQSAPSGSSAELRATVDKLQKTFESFGVGVTVTDATCGPTVTRYELLPDQGVKVKTITSLADDIKLALAAAEIRIEAPIPGKAAVGIEVPNAKTSPVLLRDLLESTEFKDARSNLTFAVGKDIGGKTICFDIASMPHMLIAGATGSGKSVCINALILSILYKAKPADVRMIMIDPKRVELVGYNGIPHLLVPVVTDVKKATGALNWAIAEMDDRYERFANAGVNNLASYNTLMEEKYFEDGNEGECPDKLPQILIIVDELNDLMMTANSKEVEASICRLTQLARASGIHVVLATQRPSVNVITGTIKANIPSRIAFSVSSIVDSRTIIDQAGAEKLLGKGDMLFYPQGYPKPVRLQGAYVSDKEIGGVVDFIKSKCKEVKYSDKVSQHIDRNSASGNTKSGSGTSGFDAASAGGQDDDGFDEFFAQAGKFIIEKQKASIGMLQRVFKIGFNRAARIMDQLAQEGIVGPEEGTKPRRILMTMHQFEAYLAGEESADSNENGVNSTEENNEFSEN